MAHAEKYGYKGTVAAAVELEKRLFLADVEDEKEFVRELKDYLNEQDVLHNYMNFHTCFTRILRSHAPFDKCTDKESLKTAVTRYCKCIQDDDERKRLRGHIHKYIEIETRTPRREIVIEVAVVLGFDRKELDELLTKGLFQTTVCFSNYRELIGLYCIERKEPVETYQYLVREFEAAADWSGMAQAPVSVTGSITFQQEMERSWSENMQEPEAFLELLLSRTGYFKAYSIRTLNEFYKLFEEVRFTITENNMEVQEMRGEFDACLEEVTRNGKKKVAGELLIKWRKHISEYVKKQRQEWEKARTSEELIQFKSIDYGELKEYLKEQTKEYLADRERDKEKFNVRLEEAFPKCCSDEAVIRRLFGGRYEDGGIMKDQGRSGVNLKDADMPKRLQKAVLNGHRYNYIRNMVSGYREYHASMGELRQKYKDLEEKEFRKLKEYKELKNKEYDLKIPSRQEFLLLLYFLFRNSGIKDEDIPDRNIPKAFKEYASQILERAGYYPIYEGYLLDALLMGCLVVPEMGIEYEQFIRYAMGEKDWTFEDFEE